MGDACEMLVTGELTLAGIPALRVPDSWPGYDVIAHPPDRARQRISVKSRTLEEPAPRYIAFDPSTCDWLAVVLVFPPSNGGQVSRRFFIIPKDVANEHSSVPSFVTPARASRRQQRRRACVALSRASLRIDRRR
jgi:hypothetical protein